LLSFLVKNQQGVLQRVFSFQFSDKYGN